MSSDTSHISKSSLSCARSFLAKKKYGRSFANFLLFIKLSPHKKEDVLDDFIHCMTEWTNQLVAEDRMDDLFKCYDQACEILPACESVLNNIGAQLFRYPLEIKSLLTYLHMVMKNTCIIMPFMNTCVKCYGMTLSSLLLSVC